MHPPSSKNTFLLEQGQQRAIPGGSDALHRRPTSRLPAQPSARPAPHRVNAANRRPSASSAPRRRRRGRGRGGPPANGRLLTPSAGAAARPGGPGRGRDRSDGGGRPELRPCAAAGGAARHHALPARRLREPRPPPPLPAPSPALWLPRRRRGPAPRCPRALPGAISTGCVPSSPEVGALLRACRGRGAGEPGRGRRGGGRFRVSGPGAAAVRRVVSWGGGGGLAFPSPPFFFFPFCPLFPPVC